MRGWWCGGIATLLAIALVPVASAAATAATFTWASAGDIGALDPYTRDETVQLSFLANIYEPLVRRGRAMALEPALATDWERMSGTVWRFHLRPGVKWPDGSAFTAKDVVFSWKRIMTAPSMMRRAVGAVIEVKAVDDLTVDITTHGPDPTLIEEMTDFLIMSEAWCEAHDARIPVKIDDRQDNYAVDHAAGTGPFRLLSRYPGHATVLVPNPSWWGGPDHNLDRAELVVIARPQARVAALLSGKVDMIYDVPPERVDQLAHAPAVRLLRNPELRTIFLGMDQWRAELPGSDVKGRNPFKDQLVREAFALTIDEGAIDRDVMHGFAHPTWLLWGPGVNGYDAALDVRPPPDLAMAARDMAAAGYPKGFSVRMDCPDDRYIDDAQICRAVAGMLAAIHVTVDLHLENKTRFFREVEPPRYRASFYLLGWEPSTYDVHDTLYSLAASRDEARGAWNSGGYANPTLDALIEKIGVEYDPLVRQREVDQAALILQRDVAYIPLHQQEIVWAVRRGVQVEQPADDYLTLRYVTVSGTGGGTPLARPGPTSGPDQH